MTDVPELDPSLANRAAPPGSMRYFALLYTPEERRDALNALFLIEAEIRESVASASHDVAHTRLRWWRAEVDRLVNGSPQHPAARTLHALHRGPLDTFAKLHELLAAADMDLARMTYANARELRAYCARSGGAFAELLAHELSDDGRLDEATRSAAHALGVGIRHAEILRDTRQDAHDGRIYFPLEMLDTHSVEPAALNKPDISEPTRRVLRAFKELAEREFERPQLDSAQLALLRPLLVLAGLHRRLLTRIATRNYEVAKERIDLGPIEKPWAAWRAARSRK